MPDYTRPAELKAGCKINLFLNILERLPSGYHSLETLFIPLSEPADILSCVPQESGFEVQCEAWDVDQNNNTLTKAYSLYAQESGFAPGLCVKLTKHIPTGAGLGGGSSDAAALLRYLQQNAGQKAISPESLLRIATQVGADVPFFLQDGPAIGHGIGEQLSPVPWSKLPLAGLTLLLVCPTTKVSTPKAYALWDAAQAKVQQNTLTEARPEGSSALRSGCELSTLVHNDFEQVIFAEYPSLARLRERLLAHGATAAGMSGSGSGIFALFANHATAFEMAAELAFGGERAFLHDFPASY